MKASYSHVCKVASVIAGVLALSLASTAQAGTLQLSTLSSDETDPALLDALLTFDVSGTNLTLTVENQTSAPNGFNINQIFFNNDQISGLALVSASGSVDGTNTTAWSVSPNQSADGFGTFDWALFDGQGNDPETITPGETQTFNFTFSGTTTQQAFVNQLSTIPPGEIQAFAAAHFQSGPDGDSAFGAVVPIPAAVWLFGSGLLGLVGIGRFKAVRPAALA